MTSISASDVSTIVHLADHMREMRLRAEAMKASFATSQRGFFTPTEDDQVVQLWVSYHMARSALLETLHSIRTTAGKASEENASEFSLAYAAALILIDAARTLRDLYSDDPLVRRKLNEAYSIYGIDQGSFDTIQLSLTNPVNALGVRQADQFYADHAELFLRLASQDANVASVVTLIDRLRDRVSVGPTRYFKARAKELRHDARDRIVAQSFGRAVYAIQEWGSRLVSSFSIRPGHIARLPDQVISALSALLKPGDVFVTRKDAAVTNYFLPGFWPHAAMYVGNDSVVESLKDGVRVRTMESPLGNDAVALIRPSLETGLIDQAIVRAHSHVGKPYDFDFDFTRADRMVCTEVVYRSYEGLGGVEFELKKRAGRQTLSAEDLLELAVADRFFRPIAVYCARHGDTLSTGNAASDILNQTVAALRNNL
ncbi:MAG: YiiX/YebB-like N1pC/P60 family cysteine hydrolase [Rubripirellula sp.]